MRTNAEGAGRERPNKASKAQSQWFAQHQCMETNTWSSHALAQMQPGSYLWQQTVFFIPEDPKVGVGAVIWAEGPSVSSVTFSWILLLVYACLWIHARPCQPKSLISKLTLEVYYWIVLLVTTVSPVIFWSVNLCIYFLLSLPSVSFFSTILSKQWKMQSKYCHMNLCILYVALSCWNSGQVKSCSWRPLVYRRRCVVVYWLIEFMQ